MNTIYWSLLGSRFALLLLLCDMVGFLYPYMCNEDALQLPQWGLISQLLFMRWQGIQCVRWRQNYIHLLLPSLQLWLVLGITSMHSSGQWYTLITLSSEYLHWAVNTPEPWPLCLLLLFANMLVIGVSSLIYSPIKRYQGRWVLQLSSKKMS